MQEEADKAATKMKKKLAKQGDLKPVILAEVADCPEDELALVHVVLQWFVQGVAVCCSVLQCRAVWWRVVPSVPRMS